MRVEIARLHQRLGTTMIYVTHDQVEAMTLADRIVVLRGGRVEQVGTPTDLYDDPDNLFVARLHRQPPDERLGRRRHGPRERAGGGDRPAGAGPRGRRSRRGAR